MVNSSKSQHTLEELMREHLVTKDVWVPLERVKYVWLDNIEMSKKFYESPWSVNQTCGLLHLRDKVPEVDKCQLGQMGYICGPKETPCSDEQCINVTGQYFAYKCTGSIGWQQARQACKKLGLDLAIVRGKFKILSQRILEKNGKCQKAWIGMQKQEKWVHKEKDRTTPLVTADFFNWDQGEPSTTGDCAVASYPGGHWKTMNCTQKALKVCIPHKVPTTTPAPSTTQSTAPPTTASSTSAPQMPTTTPAPSTTQSTAPPTTASSTSAPQSPPIWSIVGGVIGGVGITVICAVIACVIIACVYRKKQKTKKMRKRRQEEENQDPWEKYKREELKQWRSEIDQRNEAQKMLAGLDEEEMVQLPAPGGRDGR